jgi:hypothetical protein
MAAGDGAETVAEVEAATDSSPLTSLRSLSVLTRREAPC